MKTKMDQKKKKRHRPKLRTSKRKWKDHWEVRGHSENKNLFPVYLRHIQTRESSENLKGKTQN
jgi:ribosomal 30S subunit maturation factor RimM